MPTRRNFLKLTALAALSPELIAHAQENRQTPIDSFPTTGPFRPELQSFDDLVIERMKHNNIPGAALAIMRGGRLVYSRGYGYADQEAKIPVEPTSLFRLASVSKPFTAVAVTLLAQNGRLDLDTPAFRLLGLKPFLKPGAKEDPRIWNITVRHLLHHTGGWDRDKSGDIMFKHFQMAADMHIESPPSHADLIRWGMGQTLDFDPGQKYAYSNFGFCVLGRVIEKVTGMSYEEFVRSRVLEPLGITRMKIGRGRRSERFPNEVVYYANDNRTGRSFFSSDGDKPTPLAYAFNSPQVMDAHGGWIASAVDLMHFVSLLDQRQRRPLLTATSFEGLIERPAPPVGLNSQGNQDDVFYGRGLQVRDLHNGGVNLWHTGGMPGTATILVHLWGDLSWALLFNSDNGGDMDSLMHQARSKVQQWPTGEPL